MFLLEIITMNYIKSLSVLLLVLSCGSAFAMQSGERTQVTAETSSENYTSQAYGFATSLTGKQIAGATGLVAAVTGFAAYVYSPKVRKAVKKATAKGKEFAQDVNQDSKKMAAIATGALILTLGGAYKAGVLDSVVEAVSGMFKEEVEVVEIPSTPVVHTQPIQTETTQVYYL